MEETKNLPLPSISHSHEPWDKGSRIVNALLLGCVVAVEKLCFSKSYNEGAS